jgi:membrane protease YdiL (CAAX protease family)
VGVWLSSLGFGVLHQVRGRARWAWAGWATVMGLVFATLFELSGHLAGPMLAHVTINFANLRYLRDHDPGAPRRALGGLLSRGGRETGSERA